MWTKFMDMCSGGGAKTDYEYIYIEKPADVAIAYFESRFNRDPYNVSCDCCGGDYSISESTTLEEATEFERSWSQAEPLSVDEYCKREDVLVITADEIKAGQS